MRICSIITSFTNGGAETLVCNLARQFVAGGHDVTVVALCNATAVGNSAEVERRMMSSLQRHGIVAKILGLDGKRSLLKGRRSIGQFLRSHRPDVAHVHTARAALMAGFSGAEVPLILTHHNSRLSFPRHLYRLFDQFIYAYVGISAECSEKTRRYARRPVRTIANGAEVGGAAERPRSYPNGDPTIIAVGTVSDQKNYPALVAAAKHLKPLLEEAGKSFTLQIAGGGEQLGGIQDLVVAEGLESHMQLLGVRSDVPDLLRSADLFVNSSHYEGMSVAMIEGLMAALPVVATDVPGNRELIRDGENGLLVPTSNPEALASGIAKVLLSSSLYERLSDGALLSSRPYSIEECARAHLQLYLEALASGPRARQAA